MSCGRYRGPHLNRTPLRLSRRGPPRKKLGPPPRPSRKLTCIIKTCNDLSVPSTVIVVHVTTRHDNGRVSKDERPSLRRRGRYKEKNLVLFPNGGSRAEPSFACISAPSNR
ncbi:hypothetical protein EVAR_54923_1 [Eumeta japonica]|uniref:Uncharacterized protein n=1 Tax=Eumeta variegata TaxID=151549 RepID=A0A4C1YDS5_EUMVA|nr:hypothetical protein EVAR_54923_1 [Eumeta japonica]